MADFFMIQPAKNNCPLRVGAYCRVSTDREDQRHSFMVQRWYFLSKYGTLTEVYADLGLSGTTADRPEFMRMLADCRQGLLDRIVCKSVSRFARNTRDCLFYLRELSAMGVTVLFEKENIDTARQADEMMIAVMGGLAQEESRSISQNIRWSLRRKMASGTLGITRVPYGYHKTDNGLLTINAGQAVTVQRIFTLYSQGLGARLIAALFNSEKLPSPTGTAWNNVTIYKMLRQEKYLGDVHWQKTVSEFMGGSRRNHGQADSFYVTGCHPAIVDRELFECVQELLALHTRPAVTVNDTPFRRKITCGLCGRSFYFVRAKHSYWQCSGRFDLVKPCSAPILHDETLVKMWNVLTVKLTRHRRDVIQPLLTQLETITKNVYHAEQYDSIERIRTEKMTLRKLCAEGLVGYEDVLKSETSLNAEYDALSQQILRGTEWQNQLVGEITALDRALKCDENRHILRNIRITYERAEFELSGGLHIAYALPKWEKSLPDTDDLTEVIRSLSLCGKCGGRLSRRNEEGVYKWKCPNCRCSYHKMRVADDAFSARIEDVVKRVRSSPRLLKIRQEQTVFRPSERVKGMQAELAKMLDNRTNSQVLTHLALRLAEEKIGCISYHDTDERTAEILSAVENYSDMPSFLKGAVRHIYLTPDKVRVKFINGKTVKSERSNTHE